MEKLRHLVNQIAYTPSSERLSTLSPLQLSLIPFLYLASSLYKLAVSVRRTLYHFDLLRPHRLPVPVISVGNLTWGGNGKTPMVEFISLWLVHVGISPLILTRIDLPLTELFSLESELGYGGCDEARMLERHLLGTNVKIGVGANRAAMAAHFLARYGFMNPQNNTFLKGRLCNQTPESCIDSEKIGVVVLDDGMQHLSLWRDLEILLVNGMRPWGNHQLIPLGPLREPLNALTRADIVVIHHADLVSEQNNEVLKSTIRKVKESIPIFFTRMAPLHFFKVDNISSKLPLGVICNKSILCVSAIGSADSFVRRIEEMKPLYVDRIDFSDHHLFRTEDIDMIKTRLKKLEAEFASKPIVVVTEKDYSREPEVLKCMDPHEVLVLCSQLQILPRKGCTEDDFRKLITQLLDMKSSKTNMI